VVVSTLMSLFVSFTLTPMLSSRFSKLEHASKKTLFGRFALWFEKSFRRLTLQYDRSLKSSLRHPNSVLAAVALIFIISLALPFLGFIGMEFMKQSDQGEFIVKLELPSGSTLENTNRVTQQVERLIAEIPDVKKILTGVGTSSNDVSAPNKAELMVTLTGQRQRKKSTKETISEIKSKTRQIPGIKVYVDQIAITGLASGAPIQIYISGNNLDSLQASAKIVADCLRRTPTVNEVKMSVEMGNPETQIDVDRQKMAAFGLTVFDIGMTLRVALTGDDESKFREAQYEYPIRIALDQFDRSNPDDVGRLPFMNVMGKQIELQQFAQINQASGPTKLERKNRNSSINVGAYTDGTMPLGSVVQAYQKIIGNRKAGGTSIEFEGEEKDRAQSFQQLGLALMASILFVYFIMVGLYDSFIYPFVVLFSIPLALIGALFMLALSGNALSIFSILGIIMMVGLVAKNAILLVDRTNDNREHGLSVNDALIEAGQSRIRPILMTTLSMVFGMLPIALARGAGSEWKNGLAWSLIGGLTSSMFLTLVIVPIVYTKIEKLRTSLPLLFKRPFALKLLKRLKTAVEK
jgi:hydrophobic/amphiphilic exporter-1 (mainly G- bacteria), HAE1 family